MSILALISNSSAYASQKIASELCIGGTAMQLSGMGIDKVGEAIYNHPNYRTLRNVVLMTGRLFQSFATYLMIGPFTKTAFEPVLGTIVVLHPLILKGMIYFSEKSDKVSPETINLFKKIDKTLITATKIFNYITLLILAIIAVPSIELGIAMGIAGLLGWQLKVHAIRRSFLGRALENLL